MTHSALGHAPRRRDFLRGGIAAGTAFTATATSEQGGIATLRSDALRESLRCACAWITDIAQVKSDTLHEEKNSHALLHHHWRGAIRGEYNAASRQWDFFCPVWHTGQAVKSLVWASHALRDPRLLEAAKFSAGFLGSERVANHDDPDFGLILGFEDQGDHVNTSAVLECVDGLFVLSDATGDSRYSSWALDAVAWVARKAWMGDGLFRDAYDVRLRKYVSPSWKTDNPGRPLADDAIFLTAAKRTGNERYRQIFFTTVERLLKEEEPAGNWINFVPCNAKTGSIHPRQAYWWGYPMLAAYKESGDRKYLACAIRAGEWYLRAMRKDGGLFRGTYRDFETESFGHATSGIACAIKMWLDLWRETHEERWIVAAAKALKYCMNVQFRDVQDLNLKGAILEKVLPPDGTDRSPYRLRDLGTIFYVQAAASVLLFDGRPVPGGVDPSMR